MNKAEGIAWKEAHGNEIKGWTTMAMAADELVTRTRARRRGGKGIKEQSHSKDNLLSGPRECARGRKELLDTRARRRRWRV